MPSDFPFEQILRVDTGETDGDESGHEWPVHYVLMRTYDDEGTGCFAVYTDDGRGNGVEICRGYHEHDMRSMVLKLGKFVEWAPTAEPDDSEIENRLAKAERDGFAAAIGDSESGRYGTGV
jgi:hypothetical protein